MKTGTLPRRDTPRQYTLDDVTIVTTHFNVSRFARTRDTYSEWLPRMGPHIDRVVCYEAVLDDDDPEIWGSIRIHGTRAENGMFQKEALLQKALDECETDLFLWIDHDLYYDDHDWLERCLDLLRRPGIQAAQLFGLLNYYERDGSKSLKRPIQAGGWSPGGVWIAQSGWLRKIGFPWWMIIGSGDAELYKHLKGYCTYLPATVHHLWHGDRIHRRYVERNQELDDLGFAPSLHVTRSPSGLAAWTPAATPELRQYVLDYFAGRREDG